MELLRIADDAADELDDAIFLLTLLEDRAAREVSVLPAGEARDVLQYLASLLVQAAQAYLKCVENGRHIYRGCPREEMADFLKAVDRTISLEHQTDDVHRRARACILNFAGDFKQLHLFTEVTDRLENAADAMMRAALTLKDYVLGEVRGLSAVA